MFQLRESRLINEYSDTERGGRPTETKLPIPVTVSHEPNRGTRDGQEFEEPVNPFAVIAAERRNGATAAPAGSRRPPTASAAVRGVPECGRWRRARHDARTDRRVHVRSPASNSCSFFLASAQHREAERMARSHRPDAATPATPYVHLTAYLLERCSSFQHGPCFLLSRPPSSTNTSSRVSG